MKQKLTAYFKLTKPTIMTLVLFTGTTALLLEKSALSNPAQFALILLGLYLTGGGANALNQCFERDIDSQMERTKTRRPLPLGILSVPEAFLFSISISTAGFFLFGVFFNWFSAFIALGTVLFYSLFYTLWLKPNTVQNIVIGGIAGSMAPVIAWAAATGSLAIIPWLLFLIVFFWTPPHFWALALYYKDDYIAVNMPMMPAVRGDKSTLSQIVLYSLLLFITSMSLLLFEFGMLYFTVAFISGSVFIYKSFQAKQRQSKPLYIGLFKYSIIYLFIIHIAIIVDGFFA